MKFINAIKSERDSISRNDVEGLSRIHNFSTTGQEQLFPTDLFQDPPRTQALSPNNLEP